MVTIAHNRSFPAFAGLCCAGLLRVPDTTASASASHSAPADLAHRMTPLERRSSVSLALIFALRMLGLFLVLPVFALEARKYPGGNDPALVGLAMGIYGLTQAFLQLPLGLASDRLGRKRVIVAGLLVFAAGSLVAALADSITGLLVGRALQGAGAVSLRRNPTVRRRWRPGAAWRACLA